MIKKHSLLFIPVTLMLMFSGCSVIGDKSMSASVIYIAAMIISFLILICYTCLSNKKNVWLLLLFASVFIVNSGYLTLSISTDINEALLANRISYLGSVFLPMAMLMLIIEACDFKYKRWLPLLLVCIGIPVFIIAASPGYLDIYYKSATLITANGFSVLQKEYGSLHSIYLYYLVGYFMSMLSIITYSVIKKKLTSPLQALILFTAVFINIGIWLLEQLVHIEFEILSLSYIASELFLLGLNLAYKESLRAVPQDEPATLSNEFNGIEKTVNNDLIADVKNDSEIFAEKCEYFTSQIKNLTPTEHSIYELYLSKKTTKEVLDILNIKETTLKYHNKNIYGKLGVSSKRQLLEIASVIYK